MKTKVSTIPIVNDELMNILKNNLSHLFGEKESYCQYEYDVAVTYLTTGKKPKTVKVRYKEGK